MVRCCWPRPVPAYPAPANRLALPRPQPAQLGNRSWRRSRRQGAVGRQVRYLAVLAPPRISAHRFTYLHPYLRYLPPRGISTYLLNLTHVCTSVHYLGRYLCASRRQTACTHIRDVPASGSKCASDDDYSRVTSRRGPAKGSHDETIASKLCWTFRNN
ncbi:hypothetical protein GGS23DRAFT_333479 [Durotheca rogersii]|uniref:uncharacterized protein n=1 Tax=Durotheca rogersii TaxID=419775 RepID=UPI002220B6B4|nr:uncharacterized protein GGS23DRAFT_333479 [Durotheca rogersii]KAI5858283.1 hypothetical protein GGS23DRAFT_333479 [Durotheca rogersii]